MKKETKIFLTLFAVFIVLQFYDLATTHLAYKWGLGETELFPIAALLMSANYLWLGKLIAIAGVGFCCGWLIGGNETKKAIKGLYIVNSFCIGVVILNLLSIGMVM